MLMPQGARCTPLAGRPSMALSQTALDRETLPWGNWSRKVHRGIVRSWLACCRHSKRVSFLKEQRARSVVDKPIQGTCYSLAYLLRFHSAGIAANKC